MNGTEPLLTVRQLEEIFRVDRITIYRMLAAGRLRGFKVGGQWRFSRQAIEGWLREQQARLEPSGAPQPAQEVGPSPEALPLSCIRAVQEILAQAVGVGVVTTTVDGVPLTPVANCCEFCDLVLRTEAGRQRCVASWRASGAEARVPPRHATCHAGLRYLSGRVEVQGQTVAAAHAGQYLEKPPVDEVWAPRIRDLAATCNLDPQALLAALHRVPVLDRNRQEQLSGLLRKTIQTFCEIGEERLNLLGRLQRIAQITQL